MYDWLICTAHMHTAMQHTALVDCDGKKYAARRGSSQPIDQCEVVEGVRHSALAESNS